MVDALATVEQALQTNPDEAFARPEIFRHRGELRLKQGQAEFAAADFREAIRAISADNLHRIGCIDQLRKEVAHCVMFNESKPHVGPPTRRTRQRERHIGAAGRPTAKGHRFDVFFLLVTGKRPPISCRPCAGAPPSGPAPAIPSRVCATGARCATLVTRWMMQI
jgi:hypothetical protein